MNEHINDTYTLDVGAYSTLGQCHRHYHNGREGLFEGAVADYEK
mgnify:CR=1 FL=1